MKTIKFKMIMFALGGALVLASCGSGDGDGRKDDTMSVGDRIEAGADSVQAALQGDVDQRFVKDAVEMNTKELAWINAGMAMGTDAELKRHAKMMMTDHEALGAAVKDYATAKGMEMPNVDTTGTADINEKKGRDWDKKWASEMVDEHEKAIRRFERAEQDVKDESLHTLVAGALPKLRSHLDMMKGLKDKLDK